MIELIERFEAFTTSITKTYKCIQKIKLVEADRMGLKASHVMYLHYLGKNPEGLTSIELSKCCVEDKAAVSRSILDLTKKGLIKISEDDSGRKYRAKMILTEEGKLINEKINEVIATAVNKASKDLDECEREGFYRMFNCITDNLENICSSYIEEK